MQPVLAIPVRWNIRPSICRRAIRCFTSAPFTAQIISGSSSPSYTPSPFVGIKVCTTKPSIPTHTTPSSGFRNASVKPSSSARPRRRSSIKSFCEQNNGSIRTISETPSSSGKLPNGVKFLLTSEENRQTKKSALQKAVPIFLYLS